MKLYVFSYGCMCKTVHTGTCWLTLGVHACLRIAEMELNYFSKNFTILLSIIDILYIIIAYNHNI